MSDSSDRPSGDATPPDVGTRSGGFDATGHLDEDDCLDIIAGLMPGDRRDRALDHARACAECERRLLVTAGDLEALRGRPAPAGWERSSPRANLMAGTGHRSPDAGPIPMRRALHRQIAPFVIPLALAATVALVLLKTRPGIDELPTLDAYWMPASGELQRLRGSSVWDADSLFWQGLAAYESHDVDRARELLSAAHAGGSLDDLRRLHLASVLVNDGQAEPALEILDALRIDLIPMPWRDDARWMKYQALTQLRRTREARALLDQLAGQPGRVGEMARRQRGH